MPTNKYKIKNIQKVLIIFIMSKTYQKIIICNIRMTNFILIDGSYFCFFRYYAMIQWWGLAKRDDPLGIPIKNSEFVDKFKKTFIDKVNDIKIKLKIKKLKVLWKKDNLFWA